MKPEIQRCTIDSRETALEALRVIEQSSLTVALVVDENAKVIGTVTDGDVRRAILKGVRIDTCPVAEIMNREFVSLGEEVGRLEALDVMKARQVTQIPVLDAKGRLCGVHLMRELIGGPALPNWAVIMAGGEGKRLRPLTETVPKPMMKVAGRPILERLVLHLAGCGIGRIFIAVNYLGEMIREHFRDGSGFGCEIQYLEETRPLGTGGALSLLPEKPADPIIVLNGDLITDLDPAELVAFHEEGGFFATVCLFPHYVNVPYGVGRVEGQRLVELREKPTEQFLVNAGVYCLSTEALGLVPKNRAFSLPSIVELGFDRGLPVGAFRLEGFWSDIGRHEQLRSSRGHL